MATPPNTLDFLNQSLNDSYYCCLLFLLTAGSRGRQLNELNGHQSLKTYGIQCKSASPWRMILIASSFGDQSPSACVLPLLIVWDLKSWFDLPIIYRPFFNPHRYRRRRTSPQPETRCLYEYLYVSPDVNYTQLVLNSNNL